MQRNDSQVIMDAEAFHGCVQRQASGGRDPMTMKRTLQSREPKYLLHAKASKRKTTISSCNVLHCPSLTPHPTRSTLVAQPFNLQATTRPTEFLHTYNSLRQHHICPQAGSCGRTTRCLQVTESCRFLSSRIQPDWALVRLSLLSTSSKTPQTQPFSKTSSRHRAARTSF